MPLDQRPCVGCLSAGFTLPSAHAFRDLTHRYETEVLGGPFIFVLDKRKKVLGHSDIYAAGVKVPEGEITLVAYLRHPSAKLLNNYLDLPITVERALAKSIKLKVYASPGCIVAGKSEISKQVLGRGATLAAFVAEPDFSALPKSLKPGDILSGPIQCVLRLLWCSVILF